MEIVLPLITLVLGWLLGLFGPWLSELIIRPHRRRQIAASLDVELSQLRFRIACLVFLAASHNASLTRKSLERVLGIMSVDRGEADTWFDLANARRLLDFSDEQLRAIPAASRELGEGLSLKKFGMPFLSSQVASLHLFSTEFQRAALDLLAHLDAINEQVDEYRVNHARTFDTSLSAENRRLVMVNLGTIMNGVESTGWHILTQSEYLLKRLG